MSRQIAVEAEATAGSTPEADAEDRRDHAVDNFRASATDTARYAALCKAGPDGTCIVYYPPGHPAYDE